MTTALEEINQEGYSVSLPDCCFCNEMKSGLMPEQFIMKSGLHNRIVMQDPNWITVIDISPLALGHMLLLPRGHVTSLAQLSPSLFKSFLEYKRLAVSMAQQQFGNLICWEHGVGEGQEGGCGVTHAHLHILPQSQAVVKKLNEWLYQHLPDVNAIRDANSLCDIVSPCDSYLYWEIRAKAPAVSLINNLPSQFMRKLVAEISGVAQWDWKDLYNWNIFDSTAKALALIR